MSDSEDEVCGGSEGNEIKFRPENFLSENKEKYFALSQELGCDPSVYYLAPDLMRRVACPFFSFNDRARLNCPEETVDILIAQGTRFEYLENWVFNSSWPARKRYLKYITDPEAFVSSLHCYLYNLDPSDAEERAIIDRVLALDLTRNDWIWRLSPRRYYQTQDIFDKFFGFLRRLDIPLSAVVDYHCSSADGVKYYIPLLQEIERQGIDITPYEEAHNNWHYSLVVRAGTQGPWTTWGAQVRGPTGPTGPSY